MVNRTNRLLAGAAAVAAGVLIARAAGRGRTAPAQVTYSPLDVPKPVADDVWVVDSGPISASGLQLPVRMTVIRLAGDDLFLHSPTRFTPDLAHQIAALGTVRHLVAPNIAHWTYISDWQRAFPDATLWAAPGLRGRAQVRASALRIDADLTDQAPPAWAGEIAQGMVQGGGGFHEVWFCHRPSRTLLLVDLIQRLEPDKLPPLSRLVMRAAGATRGTTARYLRPVIRMGGTDAEMAIRALLALNPDRVIFAHGRYFADRGGEQLRRAFDWLV